jgi:hypothetical protein
MLCEEDSGQRGVLQQQRSKTITQGQVLKVECWKLGLKNEMPLD